ncbi:hypothetical protein VPPG_00066 [Vibrio phage VD1]|nr:hypothetical protein VPPG_00066 [Vibrio phage VD1]
MIWIVVVLVAAIGIFFLKRKNETLETVIWEGLCPSTTFSYRDQNGRQRITVEPVRLIKKGNYQNLIAVDSHGNEKVFYCQLIDSMLVTEGHKKMHFDDWVNCVLLPQEQPIESTESA